MKVLEFFPHVKLNKRQSNKLQTIDTFTDQLKFLSSKQGTRVTELSFINDNSRANFKAWKKSMSDIGIQKYLNFDFFDIQWSSKLEVPEEIAHGNAIGVEIECFIPRDKKKEFNRKLGLKRLRGNVVVTTDGSLNIEGDYDEDYDEDEDGQGGNDEFMAQELRVVDDINSMKKLKAVCDLLESIGAKVNKTCGLHVHFDQRDIEYGQAEKKGNTLEKCIDGLKQMLPKSRRNHQYCNGRISTDGNEGRSSFINMEAYGKFKTIEVRAHSGTCNFTKISNWIKICKNIMESEKSDTNLNTITDVISKYFTDKPKLAQYMVERASKFESEKIELPVDVAV
jgi:hypothetical protein